MKKLIAMTLVAAMSLSLVACGSAAEAPADTEAAEATEAADTTEAAEATEATEATEAAETTEAKDSYTIGICQLVQHVALDAATKGFEDALKEDMGDIEVTFDEQNAQGD